MHLDGGADDTVGNFVGLHDPSVSEIPSPSKPQELKERRESPPPHLCVYRVSAVASPPLYTTNLP
jgi:hypothetical protein